MGYLLQNGGLGMAGDWIITGGRPLQGRVEVPAAKNSALPLLAAALLCSGPVRLQNVPRLTDVEDCLVLLRGVGCTAGWQGAELVVQGQPMRTDLAPEAAGRMRASILFCAPLLARLGRVNTVLPGGCRIGARPIDLHLQGLAQMGVRQLPAAPGQLTLYAPAGLRGAGICLSFPSVGATENLLIAAAGTPAETKITGAAAEPEISDLLAYLRGCGALIESQPDGAILVQGREALTGCCHAILEAATYLAAAAITGGEITVYASPEHLAAPLAALRRMGCRITTGEQSITLTAPEHLQGAGSIVTLPYPGFPTDLQAIFMALAAAAEGYTAFTETVFPRRWAHVEELRRLGADITVVGSHAVIRGAPLIGSALTCTDLRAGAAVVLAALAAKGESSVTAISHIERGYADFVPTLRHLGADICLTEV